QQRGSYRTAAKKGVADILACFKGRLVAVEIKIGKDRLSAEQAGFIQNILHHGGYAVVAKNFEEFKKWWDNNIKKI
ncbi:MAG: VRR-NUC domain-containing protein, partial [Candidatus Curtissbacteria bacterium]|nr:VRR-NUC domain-containing protein [Candidatus Curtissbacteria bacterium]